MDASGPCLQRAWKDFCCRSLADSYREMSRHACRADEGLTTIILGSPDENSLTGRLAEHLPVKFEKNGRRVSILELAAT